MKGLLSGLLVFLYLTFEVPLSGMSMNPARTMASAMPSGMWRGGWIYFTVSILGMFLAAQIHCVRVRRCIMARDSGASFAGIQGKLNAHGLANDDFK